MCKTNKHSYDSSMHIPQGHSGKQENIRNIQQTSTKSCIPLCQIRITNVQNKYTLLWLLYAHSQAWHSGSHGTIGNININKSCPSLCQIRITSVQTDIHPRDSLGPIFQTSMMNNKKTPISGNLPAITRNRNYNTSFNSLLTSCLTHCFCVSNLGHVRLQRYMSH